MALHLERFGDAREFLRACEPFLLRREAEDNLALGILSGLAAGTPASDAPPYLALVRNRGDVVLVALMTPPHNLVLSHADMPQALDLVAEDALLCTPRLPGVLATKELARRFAATWEDLTGDAAELRTAERVWELTSVVPVHGVAGRLRTAAAADEDLLVAWTLAFQDEAHMPVPDRLGWARQTVQRRLGAAPGSGGFYVWEDGAAVSLVGYSGPTATGIRIGPVYTPPAVRRRGYASAAVAEVSGRLLASGRQRCFLYTDLANPTSNKIYLAVGYQPVCDADEYAFVPRRS